MSSPRILVAICAALLVAGCHRQPPMDEHIAHMAAGDVQPTPVIPTMGQGNATLPASASHAAARIAASPRHAEWVKVAWAPGSSDSLMAWIVYPSTSNAKTPVVVVIHEIYGLSTWIRSVADQAAAEGYIAIAPDLNSRVRGGPSADELPQDSAVKLSRLVPAGERNAAIAAVAKYAMSQASAAPRYAVIGFCYGGSTTWYHVINGGIPGFVGGVAFYGQPYMNGPVPNGDSLAKIHTPIMLLSGSKDARIGASMPAIDSAMKALGKWYYGKNYEGADHGFLRFQDDQKPTRDEPAEVADLAATKDAWPRTVEFLKKNLAGK